MGALFIPRDLGARRVLEVPPVLRVRRAMASPPTVTFGASTAGGTLTRAFWAGTGSTVYRLPSTPVRSHFGYARTRAGQTQLGTAADGSNGVGGSVVTAGTNGDRSGGMFQASFLHYGQMVEIMLAQTGVPVMVRVDDEYVSLTPQALGSVANATNYMKLDFGARGCRRIDVIGASTFVFQGAIVEPGDMIVAAPTRGPRVIATGDSFTQPDVRGWPAYFADALGWDDVWQAGVGGTGWHANAGGAGLPIGSRLASDVIAYSPDIVFLSGSINDLDAAAAGANAAAGAAAIKQALPDCLVIGGYNSAGGIETMSATDLAVMEAVKDGIRYAGGVWLNPVELPLEYNGAAPSQVLLTSPGAGHPGADPDTAPYTTGTAFGAGLRCAALAGASNLRVGSTIELGTGATRERVVVTGFTQITGDSGTYSFQGTLRYAHSAGETVREVGSSHLTGTGQLGSTTGWGNADTLVSADGVHPSPEGHQAIGLVQAYLLRDWVGRRTAAERALGMAWLS